MQEQLVEQIAKLVAKQINENQLQESEEKIPIGVSARHVHLSREHVEVLFGKEYQLTKKKDLMGGQFAAMECVTLVGTKLRAIENVRILGPERKRSQVEVAKTDAIRLGINPTSQRIRRFGWLCTYCNSWTKRCSLFAGRLYCC